MDRYLVVRKLDNVVANVIVWDGVAPFNIDGAELVNEQDAPQVVTFGWQHVDGEWIAPSPPSSEEVV